MSSGPSSKLIFSTGAIPYITRTFWSTIGAKSSESRIYRGYGAACAGSGKKPNQDATSRKSQPELARGSTSTSETSKKNTQGENAERSDTASDDQRAFEEAVVPVVDSTDDNPCTDLVLIIHGIGQQLATQYESFSFVYSGNEIRQGLRNQAANPAMAPIVRDRRCQVLPVQWRASLDLDSEPSQEDKVHGMDNRFTLKDITINKSIPIVREITNAVSDFDFQGLTRN